MENIWILCVYLCISIKYIAEFDYHNISLDMYRSHHSNQICVLFCQAIRKSSEVEQETGNSGVKRVGE